MPALSSVSQPRPPRLLPEGIWARARLVAVGCVVACAGLLNGCADPVATLLIIQNQVPVLDESGTRCVISAESTASSLSSGIFDVDLDQPYPYFIYPLIQNRLPSIRTSSGIERNSVSLSKINVTVKAPAGVDARWEPGCPASFWSPASGRMDPGSARAVGAEGIQACHARRMRELIIEQAIPGDTSQPVYFTLELTAIADRSGSEQSSQMFPFSVKVCAGCLQALYPAVPACADAPKPNEFQGNPCNIAQEGPQVLCCTDPGAALICPAPDF